MIWQPKKLNDLCEILIGGTPSRGVVEYWKNGTLPWVSIRDMSREGDVIETTNEKITEKGAKESNVKLIPKGSLLFSFKLSIGKLAIAGSDLYTNEAIAALVIKDEKQLDQSFLRYYISQMVFDDVTTAVKGSTLNKEKIKNLEIPIPPLDIQRQIVTILDEKFAKLREAKRLREEAIIDTEKILSTTLREIFEEGKGKAWNEKTFEEVLIFKTGKLDSNAMIPGGKYPFFTCAQKTYEIDSCSFNQKAVLLAGNNAAGKYSVKFYDGKFDAYQRTYVISVKDETQLDYTYLTNYISHILNDLRDLSVGANTKFLTMKVLNKITIPLPPLTEQKKIVTRLDTLSEKLRTLRELQQSQLDDMKKLEKAYLREAFQGGLL
jgi:type I restriction enzyme S subunit